MEEGKIFSFPYIKKERIWWPVHVGKNIFVDCIWEGTVYCLCMWTNGDSLSVTSKEFPSLCLALSLPALNNRHRQVCASLGCGLAILALMGRCLNA